MNVPTLSKERTNFVSPCPTPAKTRSAEEFTEFLRFTALMFSCTALSLARVFFKFEINTYAQPGPGRSCVLGSCAVSIRARLFCLENVAPTSKNFAYGAKNSPIRKLFTHHGLKFSPQNTKKKTPPLRVCTGEWLSYDDRQ